MKSKIIAVFKHFETQISGSYKNEIYMKAFSQMLMFQSYGEFPKEAEEIFNSMTITHLGASITDINIWTNKMAQVNVCKQLIPDYVPTAELILSDREREIVTEYYKYLYAKTIKNENPFS